MNQAILGTITKDTTTLYYEEQGARTPASSMTVSYANFLRNVRRETTAALYAQIVGGIESATDDGARLSLAVLPDALNWLAKLADAVRRCAQAAGYAELVIVCDPVAWRAEISLQVIEATEVHEQLQEA